MSTTTVRYFEFGHLPEKQIRGLEQAFLEKHNEASRLTDDVAAAKKQIKGLESRSKARR